MREGALWPALRDYWHPVTFADAVGDRLFPARVLDERIVLCRLENQWRAFSDLCIHRGTPISLGWVEKDTIVCAYHGWAYGADGVCTRIPSLPSEHPIPKKARLTPFLAEERYGIVWVCLSGRPRAPIPDFPALEDPSYHLVYRDQRMWRCSAARAMENFFDLGHFAWVHEGILGDRSDPIPPTVHIDRDGETLRFWYEKPPDAAHPVPHRRKYIAYRPFSVYQWAVEPNGDTVVIVSPHTPVTAKECTRFLLVAQNFTPPPGEKRPDKAHYDLIAEQDAAIVENQRPEELPLDLAEELHVKGPDALALAYRRFLVELGVE